MKKQNIWIRLTGEILIYTLCYAIMLVLVIGISCGLNIGGILNFLTTENYFGAKFCYEIAIMNCLLCTGLESWRWKKIKKEAYAESMKQGGFCNPPPEIEIHPVTGKDYFEVNAKLYFMLYKDAVDAVVKNGAGQIVGICGQEFTVTKSRTNPQTLRGWYIVEIQGTIQNNELAELTETKMFKPAMLDENLEMATTTHKYNLKKDKEAAQRIHDSIEVGTKITESTGAVSEIVSRNLIEENEEWILTVESKTI